MVETRKKRVLIWTDHPGIKTGFSKVGRNLAEYLYATQKYELAYYCCGVGYSSPEFQRWPWKMYGALPDSQNEFEQITAGQSEGERDAKRRWASYGNFNIDRVVKDFKPDVIIGMQDPWAFNIQDKKWVKQINVAIHTTIDSLPLLPQAVDLATKVPHYWVWSHFAERAFHKMGHTKVKTLLAPIKTDYFRPVSSADKIHLRESNNIPLDAFIVGFVFRNQLRKSVVSLMEGYRSFKFNNSNVKNPRLLLHTSLKEGWNIPERAKELNIPMEEILVTHVCINCGQYHVKNFTGQHADCKNCGTKGSHPNPQNHDGTGLVTTEVTRGVSEQQLNEVYNLMDVYCHPFTSGGMEIPIFEAKLAGIPTLVTDYSCGEDVCTHEGGSGKLDYTETREFGTEFIKAVTSPASISNQLTRLAKLDKAKRRDLGLKERNWVLKYYDIPNAGKVFETEIDLMPLVPDDMDWDMKEEPKDPEAVVEDLENNIEWVTQLYSKILKMSVQPDDSGLKDWLLALESKSRTRHDVEGYFRHVARQENAKNTKIDFEDLLNAGSKSLIKKKRMIVVMPRSLGDIIMISSLFKDLRKKYPRDEYEFYVSTERAFRDIVESSEYIDTWIEYQEMFDSATFLQGIGEHKGYFEVSYHPYFETQRTNNYTMNSHSNLSYDINL